MKTSLSKSPSTFLLAILLLAYTQTKAQYFAPKNCDANNFFKATVSGKQFTGVKILRLGSCPEADRECFSICFERFSNLDFVLSNLLYN